jgi:flagellar basal body L-ring protein FlgH
VKSVVGKLVFVDVEYVRAARYRKSHQTSSHRAPLYQVRYQLEGKSTGEAMVLPGARPGLVADIRASMLGDIVVVTLSRDESQIIEWTNQTAEDAWHDFPGTFGETD